VAGIPSILSQRGITPANQAYAAKMAEAAGLAVMRCAPLKLAPDTRTTVVIGFHVQPACARLTFRMEDGLEHAQRGCAAAGALLRARKVWRTISACCSGRSG
jgi:hypothetical protein